MWAEIVIGLPILALEIDSVVTGISGFFPSRNPEIQNSHLICGHVGLTYRPSRSK